MLIHGQSQRSVVDTFIAIVIALALSGRIEKGAEENERKREIAERFTKMCIHKIKESEKDNDGKDGCGKD